jgi:toxin FitB
LIIVDTNVVSEPFKPRPSEAVGQWLDRQITSDLFLTTISLAELYRGIAILADGKRKLALKEDTDSFRIEYFGGRVLDFNIDAAFAFADLAAKTRALGISISFADAQIAAIALTRGFAVATRDVGPFEAAGLKVINPWLKDI